MNKLNQQQIETTLKARGWKLEGGLWTHDDFPKRLACITSALHIEFLKMMGRAIRAEAEAEEHKRFANTLVLVISSVIAATAVIAVMLYKGAM